MKGYSKRHLSPIWRSNKKGWFSRKMFQDQFVLCPAVKEYCQAKNLENKVLLVLDNAPGYPTNLDDMTNNVKVAFMPPNTSLIQPMDQKFIATRKAYYLPLKKLLS